MNDIYVNAFHFHLLVCLLLLLHVLFFSLMVSGCRRGREKGRCKGVSSIALLYNVTHFCLNLIFVRFNENVELINMYQNFKALEVLNLDSYP